GSARPAAASRRSRRRRNTRRRSATETRRHGESQSHDRSVSVSPWLSCLCVLPVLRVVRMTTHPHRRFDPLRGEWIIVSPHRNDRPWQGQVDPPPVVSQAAFDPECYLCPGNARTGGARNPPY